MIDSIALLEADDVEAVGRQMFRRDEAGRASADDEHVGDSIGLLRWSHLTPLIAASEAPRESKKARRPGYCSR
jgi:hypothetical protein